MTIDMYCLSLLFNGCVRTQALTLVTVLNELGWYVVCVGFSSLVLCLLSNVCGTGTSMHAVTRCVLMWTWHTSCTCYVSTRNTL